MPPNYLGSQVPEICTPIGNELGGYARLTGNFISVTQSLAREKAGMAIDSCELKKEVANFNSFDSIIIVNTHP